MNKTIKLFLLFLEVVFLFGQIFILFDYPNVTQTRNNYRDLMSQIGDFISQNKIDKEYFIKQNLKKFLVYTGIIKPQAKAFSVF